MPLFTHAFVRTISRALSECELTHLARQVFDLPLAHRQHEFYINELRSVGIEVKILPEEPTLPDSTFVEDPVLMLDEIAVLCRLGAVSREKESELISQVIAPLRPVFKIQPPGALEGGDILRVDKTLFVGRSSRTNQDGIAQLRRLVAPWDYQVVEVKVKGCLHLKTGVTSPGAGSVVLNSAWVDRAAFQSFRRIEVPTAEPWGANTLAVNKRVFIAASAPRTGEILSAQGFDVRPIDVSELQKAEAGLTCLSVLYSSKEAKKL